MSADMFLDRVYGLAQEGYFAETNNKKDYIFKMIQDLVLDEENYQFRTYDDGEVND